MVLMQDTTTVPNCPEGHALTPDNLWIDPPRNGRGPRSRGCRTCELRRKHETKDPAAARRRAAELRKATRAKMREEEPERYAAMLIQQRERQNARTARLSAKEATERWLRKKESNDRSTATKRFAARWNVSVPEYNALLIESTLSEDELVRDQNRPSAAWNILKVKGDALPVWDEFSLHLETTVTPCQGSDKFTEYDDPRPSHQDENVTGRPMPTRSQAAAMCRDCPLIDLCAKFAQKDKPDFGVWGGRAYLGGKPQ